MKYNYPDAGGLPAPLGQQLIILTAGGVAITGWWRDGADFVAWCYPPERDQGAEDRLRVTEIERVMGIFAGNCLKNRPYNSIINNATEKKMTEFRINNALVDQRKTWLTGLSAGSKLLLRSTYTSKVMLVERTTKTLLVLRNGVRVSRKTGEVIGDETKEVRQLLTCSPQFQPSTEFDAGRALTRYEERMVTECVREMVISGLTNEG